jgi:energy-coupling factor transporter ATP-binding protein EcfA2
VAYSGDVFQSDQPVSGLTPPAALWARPTSRVRARAGRLTRVFAIVVIGPPGSGKTRVLTALHDLLRESDVGHAVIEVEAVAWAHPPISDGRAFRHLESMCRAYESNGCELIIVSATATSADYLASVVAAVAADDQLVVRLEANALTLRERIIAREPPGWSGLPQLLRTTDEIAVVSKSLEDVHVVCSTQDASPMGCSGTDS